MKVNGPDAIPDEQRVREIVREELANERRALLKLLEETKAKDKEQ